MGVGPLRKVTSQTRVKTLNMSNVTSLNLSNFSLSCAQ